MDGTLDSKTVPILLICDLQTRFKAGIPTFDHVAATTAKMTTAASILGLRAIVSEQRPEVFGPSVPELGLSLLAADKLLGTYSKTRFGMLVPECAKVLERSALPKYVDGVKQKQWTPLVIMGIEAHICIQQTTLELLELGYEVHVLADGVSSIHQQEVPIALDRMRQSGAYVTTSESWLFSRMGDASRPEFKEFARAIKDAKATTARTLAALFGGDGGDHQ